MKRWTWMFVGVVALALPAVAVPGAAPAKPAKAQPAPEVPAPAEAAHPEKKETKPVLAVGDPAPPFFLKTVNQKTVGIRRVVLDTYFKDETTRAVVISFFATWCAPCKRELPVLQKLYEKYGPQGLKVVVISIDKDPAEVARLAEFAEERGLTFPVVSDRFNLLARRYLGNATALPSLFIADAEEKIAAAHHGYPADGDPEAFLEREVRRVMGLEGTKDAAAPGGGG